MDIRIHQSGILEWLQHRGQIQPDERYHALFCDPPYHLTSIVKRFGKEGSAPAQYGSDGVFSRSSRGFLNQTWDGGDIAFQAETWRAFWDFLQPGAYGLAFAAARNYHRMATAIEDAGYVIHSMLVWSFSSGFPKATRIHHAEWDTHRYGAGALKPAVEPLVLFQKPYEGRPVDNILQSGAGTINIEAGRIKGPAPQTKKETQPRPRGNVFGGSEKRPYVARAFAENKPYRTDYEAAENGRWPSNFLLSHHPDCQCVGVEKIAATRASNETTQSGVSDEGYELIEKWNCVEGCAVAALNQNTEWASRFFFTADYRLEQLESPVFYHSKASPNEREAGLDALTDQQVHTTFDKSVRDQYDHDSGHPRKNIHATVKPIGLTHHLASLLLPPELYSPRRLLVPFAGVASEMIGAYFAGWEVVDGIEMEAPYVEIAQHRLKFWTAYASYAAALTAAKQTVSYQNDMEKWF